MPRRATLKSVIWMAALVCCAAPPSANAQGYPSRSIDVVVPFPAGGPSDVVARIVTDHMSRTLGQSLIIENVGGAGGTLGSARVAASARTLRSGERARRLLPTRTASSSERTSRAGMSPVSAKSPVGAPRPRPVEGASPRERASLQSVPSSSPPESSGQSSGSPLPHRIVPILVTSFHPSREARSKSLQ